MWIHEQYGHFSNDLFTWKSENTLKNSPVSNQVVADTDKDIGKVNIK